MTRISKDEYYIRIAEAVSQRSTCLRRHYGCVIVKDDEIIATGYNGSARGEANCCDVYEVCPRHSQEHNTGNYGDCPAVHAEQNAMLSANRAKMIGATMYLAGFEADGSAVKECKPCPICDRMIKNAGIVDVVVRKKKGLIERIEQLDLIFDSIIDDKVTTNEVGPFHEYEIDYLVSKLVAYGLRTKKERIGKQTWRITVDWGR